MKRYKVVKTILASNLADAVSKEVGADIGEVFEDSDQEGVEEEEFKVEGFHES